MNDRALIQRPTPAGVVPLGPRFPGWGLVRTLDDLHALAATLAKSGYFKDATQEAQAVVKILRGFELGIGPIEALQGIYFIQGSLTLAAPLVATLIQRSGVFRYRVTEHTAQVCEIAFFEGREPVGTSRFTLDDARAAGLLDKVQTLWTRYPKNLLFARALTNGARWYCAAVFGGPIYTPEEMGASVDAAGVPLSEETAAWDRGMWERADAAGEDPAPDPDDDDARACRRFWAHARDRGYRTKRQVHELFGVEPIDGALGALVAQNPDGWNWARWEFDRLDAAQREADEPNGALEPECEPEERCFRCLGELAGYDSQGRPVCARHLPRVPFEAESEPEPASEPPAPMPEAAAIPPAGRTFRDVPGFLRAAHAELDLVPSQVDRVLGADWRTRQARRFADHWAALVAARNARTTVEAAP